MKTQLSLSKLAALFVMLFLVQSSATAQTQTLEEIPNPTGEFLLYGFKVEEEDTDALISYADDDFLTNHRRFDGETMYTPFNFNSEADLFWSSSLGDKDYFYSQTNETTLYSYDYSTETESFIEIPNNHFAPQHAANYNGEAYYFAYDQTTFLRYLYKIEDDNLIQINLPEEYLLGEHFDNIGDKALFNFINSDVTEDFLFVFDGTDFDLVSPGDDKIFFPIIDGTDDDEALLIFQDEATEIYTMYRYAGSALTEVANPPTTNLNAIMWRSENNMLLNYLNTSTEVFETYSYDGTSFQVFPTAEPSHIFSRFLRTYGNYSYFIFTDAMTFSQYLYVYDITANTFDLIETPADPNLSFFIDLNTVNDKLYLRYLDGDFNSYIYEVPFGSTVATPFDIDTYGLNINFFEVEKDGKVYWSLIDETSFEATLHEFDGTTLIPIQNPENSSFDDYSFDFDDSGDIFLSYTDMNFITTLYRLTNGEVSKVENSILQNVAVHPNPASDYVQIDLKDENVTNLEVKLYSVLGKSIAYKKSFSNTASSVKVNTSSLSNGIYILSGKTNLGDFHKKIVIEK